MEKTHLCHRDHAHKTGFFKRRSDGQNVQRYRCKTCRKSFSQATGQPACWQKKRHLNYMCYFMMGSLFSMRRVGRGLNINPKTVARKLEFMAEQARQNRIAKPLCFDEISSIQFDELHTIEHTKCKPLSIVLAVSSVDRKILGFHVSRMPATGHLAKISRQKYGHRPDERRKGLHHLFSQLQERLPEQIKIESDECSYYRSVVNQYFPKATYRQYKGRMSTISGQGELKKGGQDPLFWINHTLAMLRANINRLIRRTWCTTKKISRLVDHLSIYVCLHNATLTA